MKTKPRINACRAGGKAGRIRLGANRLYGLDPALVSSSPPLPVVVRATQRPNSSLVDIDYRVQGADGAQVSISLLPFLDNENSLEFIRRPTAFVENTATNVGANIPVNTERLTWDASELATNFVNLQFEILAKDNRGLLPLNFITIPSSQGQPTLTMSRSGVSDNDLLSLWYWLIRTQDSAITLTNGVVKGVGGAYDQLALAAGAISTVHGRALLYEGLNVRIKTPSEIGRALSGNHGVIAVNGNSPVKLT